jgi:hypothetical protein
LSGVLTFDQFFINEVKSRSSLVGASLVKTAISEALLTRSSQVTPLRFLPSNGLRVEMKADPVEVCQEDIFQQPPTQVEL